MLSRVAKRCTDQEFVAEAHAIAYCDVFIENVNHQSLEVTKCVAESEWARDPVVLPTGGHERSFVLTTLSDAELVKPTLQVQF